ncbi:MAG: hypothetical protein JO083_06660 [Candidatus Eremiobacteraeota bacterium]|nr:hypothetical protein [Candidatus Eremiobacteraeota bacterium]MBV8369031.1 hypothetical protein [Candidatus Eremiobacteraeota bacterium]
MVNPQRSGDEAPNPDSEDWLVRFIREHIARGNRPDHARAQELARQLNELAAAHEPLGLNDDQIRRFAAELCAGRTGDDILAEAAAEREP